MRDNLPAFGRLSDIQHDINLLKAAKTAKVLAYGTLGYVSINLHPRLHLQNSLDRRPGCGP